MISDLNIPGEVNEAAKNKIVQRPPAALLDEPVNINELLPAICPMQDRKTVGRDGIVVISGVKYCNLLYEFMWVSELIKMLLAHELFVYLLLFHIQ